MELQRLQAAQGQGQNTSAAEDATPGSERSSYATTPQPMPPPSTSVPRSPSLMHSRGSFDIAREALHRRSRTPSRGATSPGLRRPSFGLDNADSTTLAGRDESAYYQAEAQSLTRENQMLRHRIRELGWFPIFLAPSTRCSNPYLLTTLSRAPTCRVSGRRCFRHTRALAVLSPSSIYLGDRGRGHRYRPLHAGRSRRSARCLGHR